MAKPIPCASCEIPTHTDDIAFCEECKDWFCFDCLDNYDDSTMCADCIKKAMADAKQENIIREEK